MIRGMMMSDDYFDIKELHDLAVSENHELFFLKELKRLELWCKADEFIQTRQTAKWKDRPYLDIYRIAIKCYSIHAGYFYLVVSEKCWKRAIRTAKDIDNKNYYIIGKHNPYVHIMINHVNCKQYKINVIESFKTEQEYNEKLNVEKQRDLF
jgi:hypothetical protein